MTVDSMPESITKLAMQFCSPKKLDMWIMQSKIKTAQAALCYFSKWKQQLEFSFLLDPLMMSFSVMRFLIRDFFLSKSQQTVNCIFCGTLFLLTSYTVGQYVLWWLCLSVCLSVCLSAIIPQKPCSWTILSVTSHPLTAYVLPILWRASCFHTMNFRGPN